MSAFSWPDYVDYRGRNEVFSALVGFGGLKISVSDPGGGLAANAGFDGSADQDLLDAASSTLSHLAPNDTAQVRVEVTVTVTGQKFFEGSPNGSGVQGSHVEWDGVPLPTTAGPMSVAASKNVRGPGTAAAASPFLPDR